MGEEDGGEEKRRLKRRFREGVRGRRRGKKIRLKKRFKDGSRRRKERKKEKEKRRG